MRVNMKKESGQAFRDSLPGFFFKLALCSKNLTSIHGQLVRFFNFK